MAAWLAAIGTLLQIVYWCLNTWKEANDEKKKQKTAALQVGVKALVDRDPANLSLAFDRLRNI